MKNFVMRDKLSALLCMNWGKLCENVTFPVKLAHLLLTGILDSLRFPSCPDFGLGCCSHEQRIEQLGSINVRRQNQNSYGSL